MQLSLHNATISKSVVLIFSILLLSTSSFMVQDAYAATPTVSSASTTSATTIVLTMSEDVTNDSAVIGDFTIAGVASTPTVTAITPAIGDSAATITLTLSSQIIYGDVPTVTFTLNGHVIDDGAGGNAMSAFSNQAVTNSISKVPNGCHYDCTPPQVQEVKIIISSDEYVIKTGDEPIRITANVGDKVSVVLSVTDNQSIQTIPFAGLYTNFEEKPSDMNLFYANNYDNLKQTSTSFYEWNVRSDDVAYDYDGTVSWDTSVPTDVLTEDNYNLINNVNVLEYFMMPFTFTINEHMEASAITAKINDAAGNRLVVTLPVTLQTAGNTPIDFESKSNQKVLGFFNESVLSIMISELNTSDNISTPVSALLGLSDDSLPAWTSDLAKWTAEDKITLGDLIVAAEYLINN